MPESLLEVQITEWVVRYQEKLLSLGVEEMLASVCAESGAMDPLFQTYISRMKITMQVCSKRTDYFCKGFMSHLSLM